MDSIIAQIRALAQTTDEAGRLDMIQSLTRLKIELQSPKDVIMELAVPVGGHTMQFGDTGSADSCRDRRVRCSEFVQIWDSFALSREVMHP